MNCAVLFWWEVITNLRFVPMSHQYSGYRRTKLAHSLPFCWRKRGSYHGGVWASGQRESAKQSTIGWKEGFRQGLGEWFCDQELRANLAFFFFFFFFLVTAEKDKNPKFCSSWKTWHSQQTGPFFPRNTDPVSSGWTCVLGHFKQEAPKLLTFCRIFHPPSNANAFVHTSTSRWLAAFW